MHGASKTWTVDITVAQSWVEDGFDLGDAVGADRLKDAILARLLPYAADHEVKVQASTVNQRQLQRIGSAITEAMRTMEAHPNDNPQDIFNEALKTWETGLRMNHRYEVDPVDQAALDAEFDANRH